MLTPATITVDFLGNYAGPHRVCWRVQGSGNPYVCTNIVTCVGGGNPCQAIINVMVETESCEDVIFEGYIQATCQVEGSSIDQVPFTVTYTPTPSCKGYILTNSSGTTQAFLSSDLGLNCDGTSRTGITLLTGKSIYLCGIAGMPQNIIDDYNVVLDTDICCSVCENYTVTSTTMADGVVFYIDCLTKQFTIVNAPAMGGAGIEICAVKNSITGSTPINITDNGPC